MARETMKPMRANWPIIIDDLCLGSSCFYTYDPKEPEPFVESISFSHVLQVVRGLYYRIEYYGEYVSDLVAHIRYHLENLWVHHKYGEINIVIYFPIYLDQDQVRKLLYTELKLNPKPDRITACTFEDRKPPMAHQDKSKL